MVLSKIKNIIESDILGSKVILNTNDGSHFEAIVISDFFESKNLLDRERLVYRSIGKYIISGDIHAISIKTYTFSEWNNL